MAPSANPFAKPKPVIHDVGVPGATTDVLVSFQRTSILPTPKRRVPLNVPTTSLQADTTIAVSSETPLDLVSGKASPGLVGHASPLGLGLLGSVQRSGHGSSQRADGSKQWRMLWKGGLEIGKKGYQLDGICFIARLSFPATGPVTPSLGLSTSISITSDYFGLTPSNSMTNLPILSSHALLGTPGRPTSPFPIASVGRDTDLCLSLESMRGRRALVVKGIVRLNEGEMLEDVRDEAGIGTGLNGSGVQVYIDPQMKMLWSYVTNALCRDPVLSKTGRTTRAIVIQLGDDTINSTASSTILIYGQTQMLDNGDATSNGFETSLHADSRPLILVAVRRKAPPPPARNGPRPGEPLPRASVFPTKLGNKPPPPIFHRSSSIAQTSTGSFLRQLSTTDPWPRAESASSSHRLNAASNAGVIPDDPKKASRAGIAPQAKKVTPGRRGEKRKKPIDEARDVGGGGVPEGTSDVAGDRRRGKIGKMTLPTERGGVGRGTATPRDKTNAIQGEQPDDGDIFGNGGLLPDQEDRSGKAGSGSASRRSRVTPVESKNKATIKKRLLSAMELRGTMSRQDEAFKEIFAMVNKGTGFAFRRSIGTDALDISEVDGIIDKHLDMYWPVETTPPVPGLAPEVEIIVLDDPETPMPSGPSSDGADLDEDLTGLDRNMDVDEPG